ncbi:hypothetical protein ACFVVM_29320 [Nocardia sp. NPDC058176]|uniref:hypothetical protein n=1 Tax=Nocardia sp. NPDC058176 TaxID=3346368 RepID=UPI0036D809EB
MITAIVGGRVDRGVSTMLSSTPPALADPVAAAALARRWARVTTHLRLAHLVIPAIVVIASTLTLSLVIAPSVRAWALPLHVLVIAAPSILAVVLLRRGGPWPPDRWTVGNLGAAAQFVIIAFEVAALLYARLPVLPHGLVAGLSVVGILATRFCTWSATFKVGHVLAVGRAASDDPLALSSERLKWHLGEAVLEADAIVWKRNHGRDGWVLPAGRRWAKVYREPTVLGEIRFDEIRAVWPVVLPADELPYCWLVVPQPIALVNDLPMMTKSRETLLLQPTAPGATPIRIPVPDSGLAATLVRNRMHWQQQRFAPSRHVGA